MLKRVFPIVLFLFVGPVISNAWSAPRVVVSIKPLHALVDGVMLGVAKPELLIKGGGSPHGYVLRPSEARALSRADLVIWVGKQLETFLEKPLATLGQGAHELKLAEVLRPHLLPLRDAGDWDQQERHAHKGGHDDSAGEALNPHLWLSPVLAKQVVFQVAAELSRIDPDNQSRYRRNSEDLVARLNDLHAFLTEKLRPVKDVPYLVFHDAYRYFEDAYGLNAVGSITVDPERRPGARRVVEIREKIQRLNARCLFSEPQFEPRLVKTIIEGTGARTGVLDPLGAELEPGVESYFLLMNSLADHLLEGLR